jgi:hypothetical protein
MMSKTIREAWLPSGSGVLLPAGTSYEADTRRTTNFLYIKDRAKQIEALYAEAQVPIPETCGLRKLIDRAKLLADRWLMNQLDEASQIDVFYALHLDRLAEALLPLAGCPNRNRYLAKMTAGELDFFKRVSSHAKDILWELEAREMLRKRNPAATLQDPPDIILPLRGGVVGIACKKIYSEDNVEKTLSRAVAQVEGDFEVGVIAMNLDELLPGDQVLNARDRDEMLNSLQSHCAGFLSRHERHFRKYLASGRLVTAWATVSVIADVLNWKPRFNNATASTMWTIPGLDPAKASLMSQFREVAIG